MFRMSKKPVPEELRKLLAEYGRKGGKARTTKKIKAGRRNVKLASAARRKHAKSNNSAKFQ